jgi:hypothetical protein
MELFTKYRKLFIFASIYLFLYSFYEIYRGIEIYSANTKGQATGIIIDACISLFLAVFVIIKIRLANKKLKAENVTGNHIAPL